MQEMQDYSANNFDYSLVDNSTADFLKSKLSNMNSIAQDTRYRMGKELSEAQNKLANHYQGVFTKWFESLGLDSHDVYFWIKEYNFSLTLKGTKQIANFNNASKTLKDDVLRKSAEPEAVQRVLSGDITTHKEYKELERKLRMAQEENADKDLQIKRLNNRPEPEPRVVEKTVTKEVTPSDYDELKREASITSDLRQRNSQTQQEMDDIKSQLEKAKADAEFYQKELSAAERIKKNNQKLDDWERDKQRELSVLKVQTAISIYSLIHDIQDFLKKENIVRDVSQAKDLDDESKRDLQEANEGLQRFVDKVNQILDGRKIIEGEFSE